MVRVKLPALQMKEHCAMVGADKVYVGVRDVLPDQARGTISWRCFKMFKMIYNSRCDDGSQTVAQGGLRDNAQGSLLDHYRRER